jgi:hypothetical protein
LIAYALSGSGDVSADTASAGGSGSSSGDGSSGDPSLISTIAGDVMGVFGKAFDFAKAQAFAAALPASLGQWAPQILQSAQTYGVSPWALAGLMYNESKGGTALKPAGAGGTGDFTPRKTGGYAKYANASGLPADGQGGWGRGLMQIDYGANNPWFASGADWQDAQTNIDKGASLLREKLDLFSRGAGGPVSIETWRMDTGMPQYGIQPWRTAYPSANFPSSGPTSASRVDSLPDVRPLSGQALYEAAIAAYNAGPDSVLQALALGLPAEAPTANQNYVSHFISLVSSWAGSF